MSIKGKHILIVTSVYPRSPGESHGVFVQRLALNLKTIGANVTVFSPTYKGLKNQVLDEVKVYRFRYCLKNFEDLTHDADGKGGRAPDKVQENPFYLLIAGFYILFGTWQLFWVCVKEKPDLLNVHWPFPHGLMAFPASKILGIPMVFSFHGAELSLVNKLKFFVPIMRWLLSMSQQATANSSYTKGLAQKIYDCPITVIPYGLTIEIKAQPNEMLADKSPKKLLCVAALHERKGVKYLLEAFPIILAKQPVTLKIIGKGSEEKSLKSQCKTLNIEEHVQFSGFVDSEILDQEYASCDVFVLPAIVDSNGDTEGQGIVLIEAMSYGKPIVASAVGGIVDAIESGKTGILVPEKDPQSLAEAILTLLANPDMARSIGQEAMKNIKQRYSWETIIQAWQGVLEKALVEESLSIKTD